MSVRVEVDGPVTTVVIDRPEARNAVDGPTAAALVEAFRAFDADPTQSVAVLYGDGGTFCAGADLKAIGTERGNQVNPMETKRRRPDGTDPDAAVEAGDRRDRGVRRGRRTRARGLVRPAGGCR